VGGLGEPDPALERGHEARVVDDGVLRVGAGRLSFAQLRDEVFLGAPPGQAGLAHGAAPDAGARHGRHGRVLGGGEPVLGPDAGNGLGGIGPFGTVAAHRERGGAVPLGRGSAVRRERGRAVFPGPGLSRECGGPFRPGGLGRRSAR